MRVVTATTATDTYAYMKARLRSESFVGMPKLHDGRGRRHVHVVDSRREPGGGLCL